MMRLLCVLPILLLFAACAANPVSRPNPAQPLEHVIAIGQSQIVDGVTVEVESLAFMPLDLDALAKIDSGYADLFADAAAVGRLNISATNSGDQPADLYPGTFGSVIIAGEEIQLGKYVFFADGGSADTVQADATASAGLWFPLTSRQFDALQSGTNVLIIITDGIDPAYTFDIN